MEAKTSAEAAFSINSSPTTSSKQLDRRAEGLAPQYQANKPFPHIYFDNFLPLPIADRTRKSIATYYFSNGRPADDETTQHAVAFVRRAEHKEPLGSRLKMTAHKLVPPLFVEVYRKLRK